MKHLITLVFALSFCLAFGQDSISRANTKKEYIKMKSKPVPPPPFYHSNETIDRSGNMMPPEPKIRTELPFSKVEIYPIPPVCQKKYNTLRAKGEKNKAKQYGHDCLQNYFTNLLGDYVMDNQGQIDSILINNCAQSARGRLKIIIDENGVISEVEIYRNPGTNVNKQFTQKMQQGLKQIAAQMKDRGELFSQAKTSDGEVVRMYYFIPMTYSPTEDLFPLLAPIPPNCATDSAQSIITQRKECFQNHYKAVLKELAKKHLTQKDIEYFKKMETDLAINIKISEIGTILELGLTYNSNKDLSKTEEDKIQAIIDKMKQGLQTYESQRFIPAQISCGEYVTYEQSIILEYKQL